MITTDIKGPSPLVTNLGFFLTPFMGPYVNIDLSSIKEEFAWNLTSHLGQYLAPFSCSSFLVFSEWVAGIYERKKYSNMVQSSILFRHFSWQCNLLFIFYWDCPINLFGYRASLVIVSPYKCYHGFHGKDVLWDCLSWERDKLL